jgi:trimethylamine--corrinoid protein Co-methyltransferase
MDAQAGAEAMFSILTAMQSRCNVIHDVGYLEFGTTSSLEMLVMADELVAMGRSFTEGLPVNEDTLALDAIDRVALGGEQSIFLTDDHTMQHFREAHFHPQLLDRSRYESWKDAGAADLYDSCNAEAKNILSNHILESKPADVLSDIENILGPQSKVMAV